jgi:iron complex transport system substrate-binding protein
MAPVPPIMKRLVLLAALLCCASLRTSAVASGGWARPEAAIQSADAVRPQRIISLVPATTEMLFAMGAEDRIVGVGNYDRYPPDVARFPRVGGLLDPNAEAILALRPDLVIVYDTQTALVRQLERAGVAIFHYVHKGLPDITGTLRRLGERIGSAPEANAAAANIESRLSAVRDRVAGLPRPKTLLVFGREAGALRQINASAGYGFLHDLLELAGGTDVLGDLERQSVTMGTEMVLARAPEVIIELHYGESLPLGRIEAERRVWNGLPSLPAVRQNRVYLLTGDEFVVPGPRIVIAAERFAEVLHPRQP